MVLIPRFRYMITIQCCCLCLLLLTLLGSCQGFVVYHRQQQYHGSHLVGFSFRGRIERAASHYFWRQQQRQLLAKSNNDFDPKSDDKTDDDLLVTLVDRGIQLFAPTNNTNSLLPPPGYLLIWAALVAFTSWIQFGFTIALYGGSKLLVDQLDQDYRDDDEEEDDTVDGLSNNSLVDLFCFLASVVLGTILIAPISSPASDTTSSNASSGGDPLSVVAGSALTVLAVAVIVSGYKEQEDDEGTIASRQLMNMWDTELQQKTSMTDRKNDDYKP